jgi:hypothetical protein
VTENTLDTLQPIEELLQQFSLGTVKSNSVLDAIKSTLGKLSPAARTDHTSIARRIEAIAQASQGRREAAIFLVRCLGVADAISDNEDVAGQHFQRRLVSLFELAVPDLATYFKLQDKKQTMDKFEILRGIHRYAAQSMHIIQTLPVAPAEFASRRQEVFKTLNNSFLKAYLNSYGFSNISNAIRGVLNGVHDLLSIADLSFGRKLQDLFDQLESELRQASLRHDFLAQDYFVPFLTQASEVLTRIDKESSGRFKCSLRPRRGSQNVIEKRYPLHEPNRIIRVKVPLVNEGPGIGVNTTAQIVTASECVMILSEPIELGNVPPGEFALAFTMLIGDETPEVPLFVELKWQTGRSADRQEVTFVATVFGQNPNVNWDEFDTADPYSTEVAHGDEFVGRRAKVLALVNRLRKQRRQSSYITGQKRVGKTSLAFAVQDLFKREATAENPVEVIYLEYGDYARKGADATVEALGGAIADYMLARLPSDARPTGIDFSGSLAPLNQLAQKIADISPRKFLIVLNEFDEIHPEMYRFGSLAETFFSNLRSLSAKPNCAFMLVGGENMPFIIGAQGDQLNKFLREPLDYFSRSDEWEDFVDLVSQKGNVPLNWHESAIQEIFNYTNGHPYYTKLLCARIFQNAVADRDTDVTIDEVQKALTILIETLDINAFAHFWKDGIPTGREEAEVIELKRCRLLVAMARTRRLYQPLTAAAIAHNKSTTGLASTDVIALLNDFCRREILREKSGQYEFVLPMFEQWLVAKGMTKLIADTLGDEMADAKRRIRLS